MPLSTGRRWRPVDNGTAPLPLAGRALPLFARASNAAAPVGLHAPKFLACENRS